MIAEVWPRSLPDRHTRESGRSLALSHREVVYDIWIEDPQTDGRAWLAQVASEALARSMAAESDAGRLAVELRPTGSSWTALWADPVSSPRLAEPGCGSC